MLAGSEISKEAKSIVHTYHTDGKPKLNNENVNDVYRYAAICGKIDVMLDIDDQNFHISSDLRLSAIKLIMPIASYPSLMHYLSYPLDKEMASALLQFAEEKGIVHKSAKPLTPNYQLSQAKEKTECKQEDQDPPTQKMQNQHRF